MLPEPSYYIRGNIYSREIQILVSYTVNSQAVSRCGWIICATIFFKENSLATFIFLRDCWLMSEIMQIIIADIRWILYHCHPIQYKPLPSALFFYISIVEMIRIVIIGMLATVAMGQSKFAVKLLKPWASWALILKNASSWYQVWNHIKWCKA